MTKIGWALVGVAVILLAIFGTHRRAMTIVSIHNESSQSLADVRIALAGKEIWKGSLAADEAREVRGQPDTDGAVSISFDANGKTIRAQHGFVTARAGDHYAFVVTEDLEVRASPPP